jgi:saposin
VKVVSEACCKVADEFIPELVETLASQMDPQVVCSVAGLCNNAWVDKQLEENKVFKISFRNWALR